MVTALEGMVFLERRAKIAILLTGEGWDALGHVSEGLVSNLWGAGQAFLKEAEP